MIFGHLQPVVGVCMKSQRPKTEQDTCKFRLMMYGRKYAADTQTGANHT